MTTATTTAAAAGGTTTDTTTGATGATTATTSELARPMGHRTRTFCCRSARWAPVPWICRNLACT
eukprot:191215-Prymnesium_polylepis.1